MSFIKSPRKIYFIKKRFQLKYTASILLTLLLVMIVTSVGLYAGIWTSIIENFNEFKVSKDLETAERIAGYEGARYKVGDYRLTKIFRQAQLLSGQQREAFWKALRAVNQSLMPKLFLLILLLFLGGIVASHKLAGPMYRFEQSSEAIRDGDLQAHFRTRKGDAMKSASSNLEEMRENLRVDIEHLKQVEANLKKEVSTISQNISPEKAKGLQQILKDIERTLSKYRT